MATAPRQQPGGQGLHENVDLTPTQEGRMRAQIHPTTLPVMAYLVDGAIDATTPHYAVLTKATAGAYTLAAAPASGSADEGMAIEVSVGVAAVHVITATGLIQDGVAGGAKTTITFTGGFVGLSIKLRGYAGKWMVIGKTAGVTIT